MTDDERAMVGTVIYQEIGAREGTLRLDARGEVYGDGSLAARARDAELLARVDLSAVVMAARLRDAATRSR